MTIGLIWTVLLMAAGVGSDKTMGSIPSGYEHYERTGCCLLVWNSDQVAAEAVAIAHGRVDRSFALVKGFLGAGNSPNERLIVVLEGDGLAGAGNRYPHVDGQGRIHLYRFGPRESSYFSALPHEMVHAFRRRLVREKIGWDGFSEEGFASFVANQVVDVNPGFPRYGFSLTVVAGHWLDRGEAIPLEVLKRKHSRLSLPCKAQAYSLRASFFDFLGRRYGRSAVLDLAYGGSGALERYEKTFGKPLEGLENEWQEDLRLRFNQVPAGREKAQRYRTTTPVQYWKICRAGEDF